MKMKRREFLVRSAAGVGGVLLGTKFSAAEKSESKFFDPYELVGLGKTKLITSRVGFGVTARGARFPDICSGRSSERWTSAYRSRMIS